MKKGERLFISLILFLLALISEYYILWLFPFTGLAGLVSWPITIITAICSAILFYRISKKIKKRLLILSLMVTITLMQSFILLWAHPQDYGGDVFQQIRSAKEAYSSYNSMKMKDYHKLNRLEKVVFIKKFKPKLPPTVSNLRIDDRKYSIWNYEKERKFDKDKLTITETDSSTIITETINPQKTLTHRLLRNFLESSGIVIDKGDFFISISIDEIDDVFDSGIEQLIYKTLK